MSTTPRKLPRLSELVAGPKPATFFALLSEKTLRATNDGKPYQACRFRDARRTVTLRVWSESDHFAACEKDWLVGGYYKLQAIYTEHEKYGPQIELMKIRPVKPSEDAAAGFDESDFIETTQRNIDAMWSELQTLVVKHIQDEPLRDLVRLLLDTHAEAFRRLPAQKDRAYPFVGGLLEHTLSVTHTAITLGERYASTYPDLKPPLNCDVITAGAILHDIGRVLELEGETTTNVTVLGRLVGPQVLGRDLVGEAVRELGVSQELQILLEHILLTNINPSEGTGPRVGLIPEALIVHYAVDLDVKFEQFVRVLSHDHAPGAFTDRDPVLGRVVFKGRSV